MGKWERDLLTQCTGGFVVTVDNDAGSGHSLPHGKAVMTMG